MKEVSFDHHGHDKYTITDAAYEQVVTLVLTNLLCSKCVEPYTEENPRVTRNMCCRCFADYHAHKTLTLVDMLPPEYDDRDYYIEKVRGFRWLDPEGKVHVSNYGDIDLREDPGETLKYWGFSFPTEYTSPTGTVYKLHTSEWYIYGDVRTRRILILSYHGRSYDNMALEVQYATTKGGTFMLMDKRKRDIRELYKQADKSDSSRYKSYDYEQMLDVLEERLNQTLLVPVHVAEDSLWIEQTGEEKRAS